jgi:HlyD family secretion protein
MATSTPAPRRFRHKLSRPVVIAIALVVALAAGAGAWLLWPKPETEPYRTAAVERGDLSRTISASGSLQALVTVQVGSQLSGQVREVLVDFNTPVKKGQVLAIVDPSTFQSRVEQSAADLAAQQAALQQQQASMRQAQAELDVQRAAVERSRTLAQQGWLSQAGLEQAEGAFRKAEAALGVSRAQIAAQTARIGQSRASLSANQIDVSRTRIVSPIDGVVVDRQVDPGQTVAASLQVSTLFQIAQDLSKLEVKILVDEADIGQVREGQSVNFSVDAFPDDSFSGVVTQVRKQPEASQNVVAYVVIAEADNPGGRLLPGMTANADIIISEQRNVLKVPSSALRWTPPDQAAARPAGGLPGLGSTAAPGGGQGGQNAQRRPGGGGFGGQANTRLFEQLQLDADQKARAEAILARARQGLGGGMGQGASPAAGGQGGAGQARRAAMQASMHQAYDEIATFLRPDQKTRLATFRATQAQFAGGRAGAGGFTQGTVWVLNDSKPAPIIVRVGATDGSFTEVQGELEPGQLVITGGGPRPPAQLPQRPGGAGGGLPGGGMTGGGGPGGGFPR